MEQLIIIALALSSVSYTISTTGMFKWFRDWFGKDTPWEDFINCPYCLSHWILLFMYIILPTKMLISYEMWIIVKPTPYEIVMFIVVNYFAIICISALFHYVLLRAYGPVAIAKLRRILKK